MTKSFGARLRYERERRHITLAEIAARTKIKASLFEQLERNDVSRWPGGLFRRSFMRAYAEAIGLDPNATLREFVDEFPDPTSEPDRSRKAPPDGRGPAEDELRLSLDETPMRFLRNRAYARVRDRSVAALWDAAIVLVIAGAAFAVLHDFWRPLAWGAVVYNVSAILLFGNTLGGYLFGAPGRRAPRPGDAQAVRRHAPEALPARDQRVAPNPFKSIHQRRASGT